MIANGRFFPHFHAEIPAVTAAVAEAAAAVVSAIAAAIAAAATTSNIGARAMRNASESLFLIWVTEFLDVLFAGSEISVYKNKTQNHKV